MFWISKTTQNLWKFEVAKKRFVRAKIHKIWSQCNKRYLTTVTQQVIRVNKTFRPLPLRAVAFEAPHECSLSTSNHLGRSTFIFAIHPCLVLFRKLQSRATPAKAIANNTNRLGLTPRTHRTLVSDTPPSSSRDIRLGYCYILNFSTISLSLSLYLQVSIYMYVRVGTMIAKFSHYGL